MPGGEGFGGFWDLCRFAVEADQGAEPAVVRVGEAVFVHVWTISVEWMRVMPCKYSD